MRPPVLLLLALTGLGPPTTAGAQSTATAPREIERVGTLPRSGPVTESSGVAVSRRHPGILWTHNDSGHDPVLYAIRLNGELIGRVELLGARAVDWEDIALGRCPEERSGDCLFVGDVGDNQERRTRGIIYIVSEPDPDALPAARPARAVRVRLTDGPHDIEALAVDPDGNVYLITKGRSGPILLYRIPRADLRKDSVAVAPVGPLPITPAWLLGRWVTGGAIAPGGTPLVLRTYTELFFLDRAPDGTWTLRTPSCWIGPREPQGEGVDFLEGEVLVLTSETLPAADGTIYRVRC